MEKETDFIDKYVAAAQRAKEKKYWLKQLSGELVKSTFYYDFKPKNVNIRNFEKEEFRFTGELFTKFLRLSSDSDLRLHMILTAGLVMLIEKYTGEKDIIVGTPVYKEDDEVKFLNTVLVLRNIIDTGMTFKEMLLQVRQTILEAVDHVNYPVELLAEQLGMPLSKQADFPLFDIVILLENIQDKKYIENINYNIAFSLSRKEDAIEGVVEYNAHRYHQETIVKIINHFIPIFRQVLFDVNLKISQVDIISEEEKRNLVHEFNDTRVTFPIDKTIHELFAEQAERTPGEIAVCSPINISDIFTPASCFQKNPYMVESHLGAFKILKTNSHHSVVVNKNMLKLIHGFTGRNNLESLFSILKDSKNAKFIIFTSQKKDLLGITHDFNRRARVFLNMNYNEFISLVQLLYKSNIIRFHGVKVPTTRTEKIEPPHFESNEAFDERTVLKDLIKYNGTGLVKADVLLLGDNHGMPTTGLLYIASFLRRNGVKTLCRFYDDTDNFRSMKADMEKMLERIQPRVVGISMKWFLYIARVIDMCKIIKEYSREHGPDIKVVIGGNTASYYWEEMIKYDCIDYLVRGDGEEPLLKIFRGEKPIPNCIYRENGKIIENPITYIQDEKNSPGIYLSHLDEILLSNSISLFGTFYVYTQKGCAMNCLYCGGSNQAQQKTFNRKFVLRRGVEEVRKDITAVKKYVSALHFEFDIPDKNLADYCRKIWEGIDLSGHFCFFSTFTLPSTQLVELVSCTFKYVYWDFDICTPSERHRKQLESLGLVRPQPTDAEIMEFMTTCENFKNIEVRPNLITGLPYFTLADLEPGEKLLTGMMSTFSCASRLHWARLHAQPGAPILEYADQLQMHSFATSFQDFLKYSRETFNRDSGYVSVENFNYPYIYFKDDHLNSRITNFYLEINKKTNQYNNDKTNDLITSETLTYKDLDERAHRVAAVLITRGVKPDDIVGLKLERSLEMIVGILGILKAGGAYMPIDPDYPQERVDFMLKDSNAQVLVVDDNSYASRLSFAPKALLNLSEEHHLNFPASQLPRFPASLPANLAYIIYTSGSSGKPKGVMVGHRNVVNLLVGLKERIYNAYTRYLKVALVAPFVFDASIKQIFGALLLGHGLYIVPGTARLDSDHLRRFFLHHKIDITDVTPAHIYMLSESETPTPGKSVKPSCNPCHFIVGGDALSPRLVERFYNCFDKDHRPKITNIYGPTECTVDSTSFDVPADHLELFANLPIGKPFPNHFIYILNAEGRLQPIGVPGELCIAGEGVARGYLNQPELTIEKFDQDLLDFQDYHDEKFLRGVQGGSFFKKRPPGRRRQKIYKTGDLARWLPRGDIEFLGRIDTQVKIRGYRIELEEIENHLTKHPEIEEALVVVKELNETGDTSENGNDDKHICAYIVPCGGNPAAVDKEIKKIPRTTLAQFTNHVKTKYDEIAVKSTSRSLTYGSLNNAANRLAHQILAKYDDRNKLSKNERIRYSRQMLIHGWSSAFQEKLKGTTVFVAGAGGGASPTVMQLALMGIGTIKICDFDEVELSNLNRQFLHDVERIGMNKAQSAQVFLERINPEVTVIPIKEKLTPDNVFELVGDADIIFDMMDDPADKFTLSRCAVVKQVPHVIIAMADLNGFATVLHTPHTPCYHCLFSKEKLDAITTGMKNYVENYSKNPLAVVPAPLLISSGTVVNEVIKILMGADEPAYNKFFYFNQRGANKNLKFSPSFKSMTHLFSNHFKQISREQGFDWDDGWRGNLVEVLDILPDPQCPLCSDQGKELRKDLAEKNKKAASVVNIKEKNEINQEKNTLKTVGILLNHDIPRAAAIMAALKAGKTIVPLDPDAPEKSQLHVLEDSELRVILTDDQHLEIAERLRDKCNRNIKIINIDPLNESALTHEKALPVNENIEPNPAPIAYLLYPSDPMGNPGFNTTFADLYTAMAVTAKSYTFDPADHKLPADPGSLSHRLRDYLLEELPGYMIPSYFVQLDKIPLTPNGKVDRKTLPGPELKEKEDYTAPGNELEEKLAGIWAEVLGIKKDIIGIDSNFFEWGGHSLNATLLVSRIHKELNVKFPLAEFFKFPTITGLSRYIQGVEEETFVAIAPIEEKEYYKLSSAQKRLYVLQQMGENNTAYNMPQGFPLSKNVDKEKLTAAFNRLMARHETLRTSFEIVEGEPVQKIHDKPEWKLHHYKTDEIGLNNVVDRFSRPFDLSKAPLLRVGLVEIEAPSPYYYLLVEMHHIISDEVSQTLLQKEFITFSSDRELPPLKLQYKDFSQWENSSMQQEAVNKQEAYWLKQFDGQLPVLNLPVDFPRPTVQSNEGCTVRFYLPLKDCTALRTVARQENATIFMVLLTIYNLFLAKLCSQEDIILGIPVAGRKHLDLQKIIGMFINSLALRNFPMGEKTVREFLQEVKTNTLEAFENQEYPFDDLVEKVLVDRDPGRNPIFDVMLNLLNQEDYLDTIPDEDAESYTHVKGRVRFDMNLVAIDFDERILCIFFYCTALFKPETIERFLDYFKKIVSQLSMNLDRKIADIEIISEAEKQQLLYEFNAYASDYPHDKTIIQLFEEQVRSTPDHLVLVFEDNRITYRQLNEQANRLGRLLRSKGVRPDTLVSLMVQRSVEMVVGIWGILKSGGAYLPVNPEAPGERITYMLDNASVTILLTQEKFIEKFANRYQVINLNSPVSYKESCANPGSKNAPTDLAYVIYTSGSTGKPKGVMIQNRSVINIVKWFAAQYHLQPGFQLLQMFEYTFDASINQIFGSLLHGVTLHVIRKEYFFDIEFLRDYIVTHFINLINFVQSVIKEVLCGREKIGSLQYVISGAEKLKSAIKDEILDNGYALYNQYGPTEVTVDALAEKCSYESNGTVGVPVYNTRCYIVNAYGRLNPPGVAGELWVSGDGLARGYINNVQLTAEKFTFPSFIPGIKVYRTGDLTRWLPAGNVEFLGRIDTQVKIRGFRIEPVEIANQLVKIHGIKEAVVIDREDSSGEFYLCAYLVGEEFANEIETGEIKKILSRILPDYMIPSYYVWIDRLPLSGHGKLIRSALPEPDMEIAESYVPPSNHLQKKLVDIWSEVLNFDKQIIGVNADFFELGGHSLKATILVSRLHKELNVKVPLAEVFVNPTIQEMEQVIIGLTENKFEAIKAMEKKEYYVLSPAQKRLYFLQQMETESIAYNLPHILPIGDIDKKRLEDTFQKLVSRHESFRTSFEMLDEVLVQKVHGHDHIQLLIDYYIVESQNESDGKIAEIINKFVSPFDLSQAPLLRLGLIEKEDKEFILMVDVHHILTDGTSYNILIKEFFRLYAGKELPRLRIQYKDYSEWQQSRAVLEESKNQEEYWLKEFEGELTVLNMPYDYPRPALQSSKGRSVNFQLGEKETRALNEIARSQGATLYMILLTVYTIFLSKLSNQDEVVVGTPVVGRRHADLEKIIGIFVNTLALRNHPVGCKTFKTFLFQLKERALAAFDNQDYPFEDLVNKTAVERDLSRNPLFDVMFSMENFLDQSIQSLPLDQEEMTDSAVNPYNFEYTTAQFDLLLSAAEIKGKIRITIAYCSELFQQETIRRFIRYFKEIVNTVIADPGITIAGIEIITEEEKKQIMLKFNDTGTDYPRDKLIHQLIEEQVGKTPDKIAVVGTCLREQVNERKKLRKPLTYMELDAASFKLARLLKTRGIRPGTIVGLMVERSLEMIIAILSIMKAGGTYLPMDTIYPAERITGILEDSGVNIILTNKEFKYLFQPGNEIIEIDKSHWDCPSGESNDEFFHPPETAGKPTDLVYVIYTSGSTGRPKGVMIEHRPLANFIKGMTDIIEFKEADSILSLTTITFDIFGLEAILPLTRGSKVVMGTGEEQLNAEAAARVISEEDVTILQVTPSRLSLLLAHQSSIRSLKELKYLLVGGEAFPRELLKKLQAIREGKIFNVYGPTETTIWSTVKDVSKGESLSIGKPIANTYVYILDKNKHLQPIGVVGELCIAGQGLARGYLNQPGLTAEKFDHDEKVNQKFLRGVQGGSFYKKRPPGRRRQKIYKTGDLARWLPDGDIEFIGRSDHQVKIRGFRIELGEIEARLAKHKDIKDAVVVCREDENRDKYICAYFISREGKIWDESSGYMELREKLSEKFPDYMIPSYFIRLERIPLTPSGKIDRKSLPHPEIKTGENQVAPRDEIEKKLAEFWVEILGRGLSPASIGIDNNFFHLGGQSLNAIQLAAKIHKEFDLKIPLTEILKTPTIRGLSALINVMNWQGEQEKEVVEEIEEIIL